MRVAFRCDASLQIGTGHVMRCLTLADVLSEFGAECTFVCRPHCGHMLDVISQRGHKAVSLSAPSTTSHFENAKKSAYADWLAADWLSDSKETKTHLKTDEIDWLIVDHYALDFQWERIMRQSCRCLMVIDDLADRRHDCDLLLDQNLGRKSAEYDSLVPNHCRCLIGPQFALLRPEFSAVRNSSLQRRQNPSLKQLLVIMGGVDQSNASGKILSALKTCVFTDDLQVAIVMGAHSPWLEHIKLVAKNMPFPAKVLVGINNVAELMAESDLAIGAAGGTAWERCCLGLPSLLVILADNQRNGAAALAHQGAARILGKPEDIENELCSVLKDVLRKQNLAQISQAASLITDGLGARRICELMDVSV